MSYLQYFWILTFLFSVVHAWHSCGINSTGSCPNGNKCCAVNDFFKDKIDNVFESPRQDTCISGNSEMGDCCFDGLQHGMTGCAEGFHCAFEFGNGAFCRRIDPTNTDLPPRVPRYRLCSLSNNALKQIYGFPVVSDNANFTANEECRLPQLAYMSTMGALDSPNQEILLLHQKVRTLVIMIHGSGRNVDDYLCTTSAAVANQPPGSVMIIAPWFLASIEKDGHVSFFNRPNNVKPLRWEDDDGPRSHTWRYGADAMNRNISSYATVDALIDRVTQDAEVRFPLLKRIIVAGHSAGGQFAQRWALLSENTAFTDQRQSTAISLRVIVANPKSFCYLDARRFINGVFRVPSSEDLGNCTEYNTWEWGLDQGDNFFPTPYKDHAIKSAGGKEAIGRRYAMRNVIYLAGELDILPNGECMDRVQGPYRRKRSEHFMESLKLIFGRPVHHRLVVTGVYHNHGLMFQSPEGQTALFGWMNFDLVSS